MLRQVLHNHRTATVTMFRPLIRRWWISRNKIFLSHPKGKSLDHFVLWSKISILCKALHKHRNQYSINVVNNSNSSSNNSSQLVFVAFDRRKKCHRISSDDPTILNIKWSMFRRNGWSRSLSNRPNHSSLLSMIQSIHVCVRVCNSAFLPSAHLSRRLMFFFNSIHSNLIWIFLYINSDEHMVVLDIKNQPTVSRRCPRRQPNSLVYVWTLRFWREECKLYSNEDKQLLCLDSSLSLSLLSLRSF